MKALRAHRRGGPDELICEDSPKPVLVDDDDVLVAVFAAGLTYGELTWDATWTRNGVDRTPIIPAHEFSGVVVESAAVQGPFRPGDEVFGTIPFDWDGAAAEFARVPADGIARKPAAVSHRDAAAIPISGLTAWEALRDSANVQPGDDVLVLGGTGAVGTFAVQIARKLGANVTATTRRDDEGLLTRLGAKTVFKVGDPAATLSAGSFDVVIDAVGGQAATSALHAVRDGGRLVALTAPPPSGIGSGHQINAAFFVVSPNAERLSELGEQVAGGLLRVVVSDTFPLDRGAEAFRHTSSPQRSFGKTVIAVQ